MQIGPLAFAGYSVFFWLISISVSHAEYSTFAVVACDIRAGEIRIQADYTEDPDTYATPPGAKSIKLDELWEPTYDASDHPTGEITHRAWRSSCVLNHIDYEIAIEPSHRSPCENGNLELTVRRNKHLLLKPLMFTGYCDLTKEDLINEKFSVLSITLSEPLHVATFALYSQITKSDRTTERPYSQLPTLERAKLLSGK